MSRKIVCTQTIVHTMLKDSQAPRYTTRRTHRTYTRQFKAEIVAACQPPGASIAALALRHGMNANVLHRWLKEYARSGRHQMTVSDSSGAVSTSVPTPAFVPVQLPVNATEPTPPVIKVELRKGVLSMGITWPVSAASDFAQWTAALLK